MKPVAELAAAWTGLAEIVAGRANAGRHFNPTRLGLAIAGFWLAIALLLATAAQSVALGMPGAEQVLLGLGIQAVTVAVLAVAMAQSLRFLRIEVPILVLLVPILYFMALVQILAIPLTLLGPNMQLFAVLVLALLIYRAARVLAGMKAGVAIAFAVLCLMVLVIVPNALYIVFLHVPSPA